MHLYSDMYGPEKRSLHLIRFLPSVNSSECTLTCTLSALSVHYLSILNALSHSLSVYYDKHSQCTPTCTFSELSQVLSVHSHMHSQCTLTCTLSALSHAISVHSQCTLKCALSALSHAQTSNCPKSPFLALMCSAVYEPATLNRVPEHSIPASQVLLR